MRTTVLERLPSCRTKNWPYLIDEKNVNFKKKEYLEIYRRIEPNHNITPLHATGLQPTIIVISHIYQLFMKIIKLTSRTTYSKT